MVGFSQIDFSAAESSGGRTVDIIKNNVNVDEVFFIVRALTYSDFTDVLNRTFPPALVNSILDDPAECKLLASSLIVQLFLWQ